MDGYRQLPETQRISTGQLLRSSILPVPQGVYDDRITIYSDNHIPYTYHVQVTVRSVLFDVLNEFLEDMPGASITFQHQEMLELTYGTTTRARESAPQSRFLCTKV